MRKTLPQICWFAAALFILKSIENKLIRIGKICLFELLQVMIFHEKRLAFREQSLERTVQHEERIQDPMTVDRRVI